MTIALCSGSLYHTDSIGVPYVQLPWSMQFPKTVGPKSL